MRWLGLIYLAILNYLKDANLPPWLIKLIFIILTILIFSVPILLFYLAWKILIKKEEKDRN